MNKRILISLSVIGAVAAIAIGGTIAYFSDTETSTGNTFTAGSIDLKIDNISWYNGQPKTDLGWQLDDLTGHLFFNYSDLKPGDWGEDTVSIHVFDNDAWACVDLFITKNDDMSSTEPELKEPNETQEEPSNLFDGELAQALNFIFWVDDGDNVLETDEQVLIQGPASTAIPNGLHYALADMDENNVGRTNSLPLEGSHTYYIGKAWCYGTLTESRVSQGSGQNPSVASGISCNGQPVTNISQTDNMMVDVVFYAVQARNNGTFQCPTTGTPPSTMHVQNLENKDASWNIIPNDDIYGTLTYSDGAQTFYGTVVAQGLDPNKEYQLTINGPGGGDVSAGSTNDLIAGSACDAGTQYCGGWWTGALPVQCQSGGNATWEGFYTFDLVDCSGIATSAVTDASGNLNYAFNLTLRPGTYSGVKFLIKENFSPWHGAMYETAAINFTVAP